MSFWSENYSFIKEVYDTRVNKMVEWMDQVEIAITKVMATKVYTSAEFKRERDNFLSLIKNLEKSDTKKWLDEVKETLFKDRAGDERKEEHQRLEAVIERHQTLIPRVHETQVKSEVRIDNPSNVDKQTGDMCRTSIKQRLYCSNKIWTKYLQKSS